MKSWWEFCKLEDANPFEADEKTILTCLTQKFNEGAAYGTLNTMRSAISLLNTFDLSDSKLLNRFFKGVFKLRPSLPKYDKTWDPDLVLQNLESWEQTEKLDLQRLTEKLVMLLALASGFRVQSLALIKLDGISISSQSIEITINELIKTSKIGSARPRVVLPFFKDKPKLCVASILVHYINITRDLRNDTSNLFISYKKPHKPVTSQTISRWLKKILVDSGISEDFSAHSTRHASTSKAFRKGLNMNTIKNAAGWSERSTTFSKFYNRPVLNLEENFAQIVMS